MTIFINQPVYKTFDFQIIPISDYAKPSPLNLQITVTIDDIKLLWLYILLGLVALSLSIFGIWYFFNKKKSET